MKKISASVLSPCALSLFSGCKKIIDRYFPGNGDGKEVCRITEVTQGSFDINKNRTGKFHYSKTLLDSLTFDLSTGSAGAQFYYFIYDKNKKLVEYRADYSRNPVDYFARPICLQWKEDCAQYSIRTRSRHLHYRNCF